jgi:hypothetical protein
VIACNQPELVATSFAHHLSAASFPWKIVSNANSFQHSAKQVIKDYCQVLHAKLNTAVPETENEYRLNCESASILLIPTLSLQFQTFTQYLPIFINYILIQSDGLINFEVDNSLLKGVIYGLVAYLHSSDEIMETIYPKIKEELNIILSWFETRSPQVIWKNMT